MQTKINSFRNEFFFLSNFYPIELEIDGKKYASSEHYYQACKALNEEDHEYIRTAATPVQFCQELPKEYLNMKFKYHALDDGDVYCSRTVEWCVAGNGKLYKAPFLSQAKEKCLKEYPDATFEEGCTVERGEEVLLKNGEQEYSEYVAKGKNYGIIMEKLEKEKNKDSKEISMNNDRDDAMVEIGALWEKKSRKGEVYYDGNFGNARLIAFVNKDHAEGDNRPAIKLCVKNKPRRDEQ